MEKEEEKKKRKKLLLLLLLLLFLLAAVISTVVFLKDDGKAEAASNEIMVSSAQEANTNGEENVAINDGDEEVQEDKTTQVMTNLFSSVRKKSTILSSKTSNSSATNSNDDTSENQKDTTAPKIALNGEARIIIEAGIENYEELGATVTDNVDATITDLQPSYINYSVNGSYVGKVNAVDTTKPGVYKVVYEYTDAAGNKGVDINREDHTYVIRTVTVQDTTAPRIALNGEAKITIEAGIENYEELGATVTDNVDATITNLQPSYINYSVNGSYVGKVNAVDTTKPGVYKVVYEYTDAAGNKGVDINREDHTYVIRTVTVQDTTAPKIALNGEARIIIEAGIENYEELGAIVTDNVDATITNLQPSYINYSVNGSYVGKVNAVDTTKPGVYKVVYEYTDAAGNKGVDINREDHTYVIRIVTVQDTMAPRIALNGEARIIIEAGIENYEELGATVTDNVDVTITNLQPSYINYSVNGSYVGKVNAVDTTKPGVYKVVYEYTDAAGNKGVDINREDHTYVIRTVTVQDTTAPRIALNGEAKITIEAGIENYEELGATVTDNVDATITDLQPSYINYSVNGSYVGKVNAVDTTKPGVYKVVYEYTDAAGNKGVDINREDHTYVIRTVTVQDTTAPRIALNGEAKITIEAGIENYKELGATVTDNVDATITDLQPSYINYSVNGSYVGKVNAVDTTKPGVYKVVYEYTDAAGNKGVDINREDHTYVIRTVTVQDTMAPTAEVIFDGTTPTNKLFVTLKFSEKIDETTLPQGYYPVAGEENTYKKAYYSNKDYTVTFKDIAGNEGSVSFTVTNIDRVAPTAEVIFDGTTPTNKLFVTLKFSEKIDETTLPQGYYPVAGEENTYKKAYYSNKDYTVTFKDIAGNEGSVSFTVTNIDRVAPTAEVIFDGTTPTNKLFVTLKFIEKIDETTLPQGYYPVAGEENTYKKAYYSNKDYTVTFKDIAGNEGSVSFTITNIE